MLLNNWLKSWESGWKRDRRRQRYVRPGVQQLENRVMLSTIAWTNRGNAVNDSDGFAGVFGAANAELARNVVDAARLSWQSVIADFKYGNGGNTYLLTVNMATSGVSLAASAGPRDVLGGKPTSGAATIGRGHRVVEPAGRSQKTGATERAEPAGPLASGP